MAVEEGGGGGGRQREVGERTGTDTAAPWKDPGVCSGQNFKANPAVATRYAQDVHIAVGIGTPAPFPRPAAMAVVSVAHRGTRLFLS